MTSVPKSYRGVLHGYHSNLVAFEHDNQALQSSTDKPPTLIFVGGLGDGLLTVPLVQEVQKVGWSVVEATLSSSHNGWGSVTIRVDALELAACVEYFKSTLGRPKVVIMGHSTGSQDVLEYLCRLKPEEQAAGGLDGAILQAPVSDREGMIKWNGRDKWEKAWKYAQQMIEAGNGDEIIPKSVLGDMSDSPVTANRWYSISSPNPDAYEDFFSSDISDDRLDATFGKISPKTTPFLILYGGADEFVPDDVNKEALVKRWVDACTRADVNVDTQNSGVIPGGTHNMEGVAEEVNTDMRTRIHRFLGKIWNTTSTTIEEIHR